MIATCTSDALPLALPIGGVVRELDTGIWRRRTDEHAWLEVGRRVQLSRQPGARLPEGATIVDRRGKWGNPWRIEHLRGQEKPWTVFCDSWPTRTFFATEPEARAFSVDRHRIGLRGSSGLMGLVPVGVEEVRRELARQPLLLACWCALDVACHADNYLEVLICG